MNIKNAVRQCHNAVAVSMLDCKLPAPALCHCCPSNCHATSEAEDVTTVRCGCGRVASAATVTVITTTSCCRTITEVDKSGSSNRRERVIVVLPCRLHKIQGERDGTQVEVESSNNEWSKEE